MASCTFNFSALPTLGKLLFIQTCYNVQGNMSDCPYPFLIQCDKAWVQSKEFLTQPILANKCNWQEHHWSLPLRLAFFYLVVNRL